MPPEQNHAAVRQTPSTIAVQSMDPLPTRTTSKASIELKPKEAGKISLPKTSSKVGLQFEDAPAASFGARVIEERRRASDASVNSQDSLQEVQIVSRKSENQKSKENLDGVEDSLRSLVWPAEEAIAQTPMPKKPLGRLSPEGAPDDLKNVRESSLIDTNENSVPRGLPMKSYKKFTFERNGGQVVVREKICQKEQRDGNKKVVIEKKVTSRTSSFDLPSPPVSDGFEGAVKTGRRDDSSDEDDFDIHFDSSHGPLGLLNVMKFMDRDFRTRWQNHPIFQNLSRRPLGMSSELMQVGATNIQPPKSMGV